MKIKVTKSCVDLHFWVSQNVTRLLDIKGTKCEREKESGRNRKRTWMRID